LENFAFRHDISHPGDQFKNIVVADFAHQHKGLETQKIAHQNTDGISEYFIGGRFAASDQGLINDIVMQECCRMNVFHDGPHGITVFPVIAAKPGRDQQQKGTESLPAAVDQMMSHFGN